MRSGYKSYGIVGLKVEDLDVFSGFSEKMTARMGKFCIRNAGFETGGYKEGEPFREAAGSVWEGADFTGLSQAGDKIEGS